LSCAPKPPKPIITPAAIELPKPYNLRAETDSHKATLYWEIDRSKVKAIAGYNIYLEDDSAVKDTLAWKRKPGEPYNHNPYPGDTDGDISKESIPLENLISGTTYFAFVRLVGADGKESGSSNIAVFQPLAHGKFTITDNHEVSDGGYNFENEMAVPGRDPRSDIYLYATSEKIGLSSPSRLGAGFRKSRFASAGDPTKIDETIQISTGDKIEIKTKYGRAEIVIEDLTKYPNANARIRYNFYPDKAK
jgi:hypothetical protein